MPNKQRVQEREEARRKAQRARTTRRLALAAAGVVLVVAVIALAAFLLNRAAAPVDPTVASATCDPVQTLADEGRNHLVPGETPTYQTNPPTSGTHNPEWQTLGVYGNTQDLTMLVHSLEHGYIVIYYRELNDAESQALANIAHSDQYKVIVNPYALSPARVVLTAWDHMQKCSGVNLAAIREFTSTFRDRGPEQGVQ